jgi:hypothetical protein
MIIFDEIVVFGTVLLLTAAPEFDDWVQSKRLMIWKNDEE